MWREKCRHLPVWLQPEDGQAKRDCWTVAFGNAHDDTDRMVAAGYDNGDVKVGYSMTYFKAVRPLKVLQVKPWRPPVDIRDKLDK